jgi:REP element-mobilizing transposase RayT
VPHRKPLRYPNYNYSNEGVYFITICTKDQENMFGRIISNDRSLNISQAVGDADLRPLQGSETKQQFDFNPSEIGKLVQQTWNDIPKHFPQVIPDDFVLMPNHLHGILILNSDLINKPETVLKNAGVDVPPVNIEQMKKIISEQRQLDLNSEPVLTLNHYGQMKTTNDLNSEPPVAQAVGDADLRPLRGSDKDRTKMLLSKVVHGFKSTVTRIVRKQFDYHKPIWQRSFHDRIVRNPDEHERIREYIANNPVNWKKDKNYR